MDKVNHNIRPVYDADSKVLVLGSFPSVKSREARFFYGHPQNRFWKVLAAVTGCEVPLTVADKTSMLLKNHIALWDTIASCEIDGSSDSSIRNAKPNDISIILNAAPIRRIYCNGSKSYELYRKYCEPVTGVKAVKLPSTSPANAAFGIDRLIEAWKVII